jgi:hypothetical protein
LNFHLLSRSPVYSDELNTGRLQHPAVVDGLVDVVENSDLAGDRDVKAVVSHLDHLRQQLPLVLEERPEVPSTGNDLKI